MGSRSGFAITPSHSMRSGSLPSHGNYDYVVGKLFPQYKCSSISDLQRGPCFFGIISVCACTGNAHSPITLYCGVGKARGVCTGAKVSICERVSLTQYVRSTFTEWFDRLNITSVFSVLKLPSSQALCKNTFLGVKN